MVRRVTIEAIATTARREVAAQKRPLRDDHLDLDPEVVHHLVAAQIIKPGSVLVVH